MSLKYALPFLCTYLCCFSVSANQAALTAFQQGRFAAALQHWQQSPLATDDPQHYQLIRSLLYLGRDCQAQQQLQAWSTHLKFDQQAIVQGLWAIYYQDRQQTQQAQQAIEIALLYQPPTADLWLIQANLLASKNTRAASEQAEEFYKKAIEFAKQTQQISVLAQALLSYAQFRPEANYIQAAKQALFNLPMGYIRTQAWWQWAHLDENKVCIIALKYALQSADKSQDHTHLARIYLALAQQSITQQPKLAQQYLNQAKFSVQYLHTSQLHYQIAWLQGQLFAQDHQVEKAIVHYEQALQYLQSIKQHLFKQGYQKNSPNFSQVIGDLYRQLTALYMQQQAYCQAMLVWDRFNEAAIQDYYQDQGACLRIVPKTHGTFANQSKPQRCLENLKEKTRHIKSDQALFYPLLLKDELHLLLWINGKFYQRRVPFNLVQQHALRSIVKQFNQFDPNTVRSTDFHHNLQQGYDALIKPIDSLLRQHQIGTLMIVAGSRLRNLPFAALHNRDTQRYLMQDYAHILLPGLVVSDPKITQQTKKTKHKHTILLAGLSESVRRHPPLIAVKEELESIELLFPHAKSLLNKDFSSQHFLQAWQHHYQYVHIASHAQFSDKAKDSFIVTYHDNLYLQDLSPSCSSAVQNLPVPDLLVLSACQTLTSSPQVAMGLVGLALKTGIPNVMGNLWKVDDDASNKLNGHFYQNWQKEHNSLPIALQKAQQTMLTQYSNDTSPYYWAAFVLTGQGVAIFK